MGAYREADHRSIQALEHRCAQQACAIEDLRCVQVAHAVHASVIHSCRGWQLALGADCLARVPAGVAPVRHCSQCV